MEFRILGPLEVWADGAPIAVRAAKQRALLAALLLHPNEVVSIDALVDALWGETPVASAPKLLQVYVSQLRKSLPAGRLQTRAPGYALALDPEELDAVRFERLVIGAGRSGETRGAAPDRRRRAARG